MIVLATYKQCNLDLVQGEGRKEGKSSEYRVVCIEDRCVNFVKLHVSEKHAFTSYYSYYTYLN